MSFSYEEMRQGRVRAENMLRRIYNELGPGSRTKPYHRKEPIQRYAALTRKQVDQFWDFDNRQLMHRIARLLCR